MTDKFACTCNSARSQYQTPWQKYLKTAVLEFRFVVLLATDCMTSSDAFFDSILLPKYFILEIWLEEICFGRIGCSEESMP